MGEQLSMLDTMFLELEQLDESAHMHIGAALVFDPLPRDGTPDIAEMREHARTGWGSAAVFAAALQPPCRTPTWLTWEPADLFDLDAHMHHAARRHREARPSCTSGSGSSGRIAWTATGRSGR